MKYIYILSIACLTFLSACTSTSDPSDEKSSFHINSASIKIISEDKAEGEKPAFIAIINNIRDKNMEDYKKKYNNLRPGFYSVNFTYLIATKDQYLLENNDKEGYTSLSFYAQKGRLYMIKPIVTSSGMVIWSVEDNFSEIQSSIVPSIKLNHDFNPLIMIKPKYPSFAIKENITSKCTLSFDLKDTESGAKPTNIQVKSCPNKELFLAGSIENLQRWLYSNVKKIAQKKGSSTTGLEVTFNYSF
ncbi:hypothetical protein AN944_04063 [Shewanella sp. P1-14-1]|uniref:hypothetical protein n=1 Tax=Shewanella TaxID=22 RepID=UPI0006D6826C|nr:MULTISPECIES: hypothetical protein [Shewanella]KPZ67462.1 hypothetical protein AN944_04063 [Shewanella sp. P1-14-1]